MSTSSTHREIKALLRSLQSLSRFISGKSIIWYTDNLNCVGLVKKGSMKSDLHSLALSIVSLSQELDLRVFPVWIPRESNTIADSLSRASSYSDSWSVNDSIFNYFNRLWGPYTFDRFADNSNTKCPRFNSKLNCPDSSGINAFLFDWSRDNNWLVPPVSLLPSTILHLRSCRAVGTLVAPKWLSAPFWPLLSDEGGFFSFVKDHVEYTTPSNFFNSVANKMFGMPLKFNVVVFKLDFSNW